MGKMAHEPALRDDPPFWGTLYTVLSLDAVQGFHKAMGVPIDRPEKLKDVIRSAILDNRRAFSAGRTGGGIAERGATALRLAFGAGATDRFLDWAQAVFVDKGTRHLQWAGWQVVFIYLKGRSSELDILGPGAAARVDRAYQMFLKQSDIEGEIDKAQNRPLSVWDLDMYVRHDMDHDDPAKFNPFTPVALTTTLNFFQLFWREALSAFLPAKGDVLHQLGQCTLTEADVELPMPLAHPALLIRHAVDF